MSERRSRPERAPGTASLFKATEVQDLSIHPDGRTAICSINSGDNWELATLDLRTGNLKKYTKGDQSMLSPKYSPSGDSFVFQADFEGNEDHDVFIMKGGTKKPVKLTDGVADNAHPEFSPDGSIVAFVSNRDSDIENLFAVDVSGGPVRKLTSEELPVRDFAWAPDGRRIAYGAGIGDDDYISVVDVRTSKTRRILSKRNAEFGIGNDYGANAMEWSHDGSKLFFTSNEDDPYNIGELDISTRKRRWVVRSKNEKYAPTPSPRGDALAYLEVVDPDILLKVRSGSRTRTVSLADGVTRIPRWLPDGSGLVFANGSSVRPEELYVVRSARPRRITRLQPNELPTKSFAYPELVKYRSFDGRRISAMLFTPRDRSRRAGIVIPHGGPEMQSVNMWDQIFQVLVMKGFTVIAPNYRGSIGYGREFLHLHDMDLGGGDLFDTVEAGKYLVKKGLADEDKVGFWGASYGGYLCMLAMTKAPEVWAAGVSIVGFFDYETELENERGFLKAYDLAKMGDPVKNRALYRDRSPIDFLENLRAPLLMVASARDVRCPPTESREVVKRLEKMGRQYEYHEYPDEGHWPRKRKNLRDMYERSARFLDGNIPR